MRRSKSVGSVNGIAFLNILSVIILQGIAFLSTPIFSRMLGTFQYGQYSVFNSWVTIITCFMGLGVSAAIGTGRYHFKDEYKKFRTSVLFFSIIICLIEIAIIVLGALLANALLSMSVLTVVFISILSFSHYVVNFAQNALIYEKKALHNFILSVVTAIITTAFSIYLVYIFPASNKYMGRVYGMMLPYALIAVVLLILFLVRYRITFEKKYIVFGLQVGFPIVFHSLSQSLLSQSDRVMMEMMNISNSEIGIYSLFYTLISVLTVILNALNNTWCPFYYDNLNNNEYNTINIKIRHYIELFSILTFGFLMLSPEVSKLMADSSYYSGIKIIPILVTSVFFTFMYQFPVNYEFYHKKTSIIATGTLGAALVNILLNFILIPSGGMYGAAIATSLSYLALFIVHYCIVCRLKDVNQYHTRVLVFIPAILFVLLGILLFYILMPYWIARWSIGIILGIIEVIHIVRRRSIF